MNVGFHGPRFLAMVSFHIQPVFHGLPNSQQVLLVQPVCSHAPNLQSSRPLPHPPSPTGGVALAFLFFTLHLNPPKHNKTFRQHLSEFDFLGLFLIVAGVICLLLGFNQSENSCKCTSLPLELRPCSTCTLRELSFYDRALDSRRHRAGRCCSVGRVHVSVTNHPAEAVQSTSFTALHLGWFSNT